MLRIIHNQTVQGGILIDDIDDGLPNKTVHRLGSTADPKAYKRDGYANSSKQSCYVPFSHTIPSGAGGGTTAGYITINQTNRVLASAGKGKISKLQTAGLVTVVSTTAANLVAPVISSAPSGTDPVVITGTTLTSVSPDTTTVTFAQGSGVSAPSPATFTQAQIIAGGGSVGSTSISIPAAMFTVQVPVTNNTVKVTANEQNSNTFVMT